MLFGRWLHARGKGHCREKPGRAKQHVQANRGTLLQVSLHHPRRGRRAVRLSTSQGRAESLCARIKSANRGISEGKTDLEPWSVFFLRGSTRSGERPRFPGRFSRIHRAFGRLDAGVRAGFTSSRPPPPWTLLGIAMLLIPA